MKSLTQIVKEAGFEIVTDTYYDRVGPANLVIIIKDGKRTQRRARKYEEALALCAEARGIKQQPAGGPSEQEDV